MRSLFPKPHQPRLSLSLALLIGVAALFSSLPSASASPLPSAQAQGQEQLPSTPPTPQSPFPFNPNMAKNLRNDDGTVNLAALRKETAYIESKYKQNAKNYEVNTGKPFYSGPDVPPKAKPDEDGKELPKLKLGATPEGSGAPPAGHPRQIDASFLQSHAAQVKNKYATGISAYETNTGKSFASAVEDTNNAQTSTEADESKKGASFLTSVPSAMDGAKAKGSCSALAGAGVRVGVDTEKQDETKYND